jgi:hypothetical protein
VVAFKNNALSNPSHDRWYWSRVAHRHQKDGESYILQQLHPIITGDFCLPNAASIRVWVYCDWRTVHLYWSDVYAYNAIV